MQTKELPIGYWIKQADQLLTKNINNIQSSFGLTRTEWQTLSYLKDNKVVDKPGLIELMVSFADNNAMESILNRFKSMDIISEQDLVLTLTSKGQELYAACFKKQKAFRESAMEDITEQDYRITLMTLKKLVENISGNVG